MTTRKQRALSPTKGQKVAAEARRYKALELTKAGKTEREIATILGVSRGLVHIDVKRILGEMSQRHSKSADTVRALQMERYNQLLSQRWDKALEGDAEAMAAVLKVMARIDQINGIIPDKPLIDMRTQTIQMGEDMGLTLHQMYVEAIKQNGGKADSKPLLKEPSNNGVINGTYSTTD